MPGKGTNNLNPEQARRMAEECYAEVLAYCRRHAPVGYEPADLTQETFLRFVRAGSYREQGRPIAYLMRIARSVCIDASRKRRPELVAIDFDLPAKETVESGVEVEEALAKLPDDLRDAIELRYGLGLSMGEVAYALGTSRFSVRRRINAALKLLEKELREGGPDE
ncbi:MAG: sigma-70 family RNA polymerase sigma factor [Atopobiaceae bacterium]|nr:sigma-70 family RNA polymerase sigma factor [Atopobiaceae bacterium]